MADWFKLSEADRASLFKFVAGKEGLPPVAIEKDWWVTLALNAVFSMPVAQFLVFKGGTSLSKGWGLIERFSEDIDLAINREYLGFKGEMNGSQIRKLRRASCAYVKEKFTPELTQKLNEMGVPNVTVSHQEVTDTDVDPLIVELAYPSLVESDPYIRSRVLIEIGARSLIEPFSTREIKSLMSLHVDTSKGYVEQPMV